MAMRLYKTKDNRNFRVENIRDCFVALPPAYCGGERSSWRGVSRPSRDTPSLSRSDHYVAGQRHNPAEREK